MATVKREPIGDLHDKLVVTISKEDYFPAFEKSLKQYGKNANVPGFRKGNVPVGMIRKMYGQSVFADEVFRSANRELENYLKENKPEIFAQPLAMENQDLKLDMNTPGDFDISFEIGLKPEFEITPLNKKGHITRYKIKVTEDMLDKEVENMRRRAGKIENPDTLENDTDIVYATYEACNEQGEVTEGVEKTEDVVTLEQMPQKLALELKGKAPEFTMIFQPGKVCEEAELATFMKSALKKEPEYKDDFFKLTLTKIGRIALRDMDEAFFGEIFPNADIQDEAGFKAKLKDELEKETERLASERLQNELFETLIHETPLSLPVDFLKSWLKRSGETVKSEEEVAKEFPGFDHQLRWTLISDKLLKENDIQVSLEEVMADVKTKVMAYFGMKEGDDAPWMDSYLEKMSKDEKTMDETYRRLLFDKLFKKLEAVMEVKSEEIDEDAYSNLPVEHHHHY
jgi:trigger factor